MILLFQKNCNLHWWELKCICRKQFCLVVLFNLKSSCLWSIFFKYPLLNPKPRSSIWLNSLLEIHIWKFTFGNSLLEIHCKLFWIRFWPAVYHLNFNCKFTFRKSFFKTHILKLTFWNSLLKITFWNLLFEIHFS